MPRYPVEPVAIEYTARGKRTTKVFVDHYAARRFYASKMKQGKHPKVRRVS
jgi:hypothetical protein